MKQKDWNEVISLYATSFEKVLYEEDTAFMDGMKKNALVNDDIRRYQHWEWTQGVGLYGFWNLYQFTKDEKYLSILTSYYERQIKLGLPSKNVNTMAPMLTLAFLAEHLKRDDYMKLCVEWAEFVMKDFIRTKEGGLQHITSDTLNDQELWDDTLFMTVLFLAKVGKILNNQAYIEEAKYQFMLHLKYLCDTKTGLWYHGWTFEGNHNFASAFWGRGNCWITIAIPEFLEMIECDHVVKTMLTNALIRQAESLKKFQAQNGMWRTLVDDETSYVEASATCGFGYGLLKGVSLGILDESYTEVALKPLNEILNYTNEEGILHQVSYGTPMGRDSKQFYKDIELKPMPYGQALAMLYLMEVMKLQNK
ncbi:MAG TPA: glycoside hydrolase 105 family protein [Lachnoclostridium phytofermentans]|uniref:Glycoside hydrolase 105 family protein n=1 Tax=Lachnoclostridium phytofermentans TaxID=66219 RepID=A0A3D2XB50_9FIRM|nr:glycoside hydrolase family 88 protein [Lachnoclostridium sp.]HCL04380.1 glycoside hydrolase 105 family protein [Lachnoclostridium phytofermentans]